MNTSAREKIFKTWSSISEVALIKEVATKGEHIQLCIEYWARKRKVDPAEYKLFFHDVVQTYVQRLLAERLVCKAETVLRNVQRDYRCVYFQYACESTDTELRELLHEHLQQRDPFNYEEKMAQLQFYWELMQQLHSCPTLHDKYKQQMRRVNLETLTALDDAAQQRLMVELYFENVPNSTTLLLPHLEATVVWQHLIELQRISLLVRWCCLQTEIKKSDNSEKPPHCDTDLERRFCQWPLETEMYEYALRMLQKPNETLRNCFAQAGYFFADERKNVSTVLRRICTTESFEKNRELLERLPLGGYLLERGYFVLMLRPFVGARELEELAEAHEHEHGDVLKLIVALKEHDLTEREGFEKIAKSVKTYLESDAAQVNFENEQPLVTFYEFLCNEPSMDALNCFLLSSALKHVPYLKSLARRLESNGNGDSNSKNGNNLPSPYDFLRKFKHIDFKEICKDTLDEVASFSNKRLCERYARKYQLNFVHHLKQQRGAFAAYFLLTEQLQQYAQMTRAQLFAACETVTELALQNASNEELLTHCVAFIEILGFDTQQLRCFLKLSRLLLKDKDTTVSAPAVATYADIIVQVERVLANRLAKQQRESESDDFVGHFPLADYQALMRIVACNQHRQWPQMILRQYAAANDWWRLLVMLQYFEVPLSQVSALAAHFGNRAMGEHFLRALSYDTPVASSSVPTSERNAKRQASFSRRQHQKQERKATENPTTTSAETMTSSISSCNDALKSSFSAVSQNHQQQQHQQQQLLHSTFLPDATGNLDIFAIILLSTNALPASQSITSTAKFLEFMQDDNRTHDTACNLMKNSVKFRLPVLAVLAATVSTANVDWMWLVWLAVATDQWQNLLQWTTVTGETQYDVQQELTWRLIENSVRLGATATLYRSFCIFYENNPLVHLLRFLHLTQNSRDFSDEVIHELRMYLLAWSNDEIKLPLSITPLRREQLMLRTLKLLLVQLQHNFESTLEQQKFLSCICRSDMSDISGQLDFCLLVEVFTILQTTNTPPQRSINFEALLQRDNKEYEQHLQALLEARQYDAAVRLATLLHLPISDIVYAKWVDGVDEADTEEFATLQRYEDEIIEHSLPPELLVNFFLYGASRIPEPCTRKYLLLKRALNVIKRNHLFPNESFDRDQIEYEMISCYLQIPDDDELAQLEIYHSEYFEEIMLKERCVLYKSFLELKELAGIEDLNVSLKAPLTPSMQQRLTVLLCRLLDEGDIVEAVRLQDLFEWRPNDLRFIVFCMALAEGVTTIYKLSFEERHLLCDIEKGAFSKFNKRTLDTLRCSSGSHSSPLKTPNTTQSDLSDSCSTLEFEEIPAKEKRETLDIIQGIASKLTYGVNIAKRIVLAYRAAMYLDKEYLDVLRTKDTSVLVQSVAEEGCLRRLLVVSDILTSTHMTDQEIADLLAFEITTAVVRPRFYIFSADQHARNIFKNANLWGYNIDRDLHLFLELTPNTTKLGHCLLEYCDALKTYRKYQDDKPYEHNVVFEKLAEIILRYGVPPAEATAVTATSALPPQVLSHKKQNLIYVELLIKAHQCFVHECSMEGIANVLNRAKALSATLTKAKSWSLLVRMLVGIGRYREMFYCFDALIENEQFESLLGQFDEDRGLRQAILAYLREYCPENGRELLRLAALHFLMYKELAELWEQDAKMVLERVRSIAEVLTPMLVAGAADNTKPLISKLRSTPEVLAPLQQALEYYTHATENYLLDNKMMLAQKSAARAEMIAMQIDLANKALLDKNANSTALHMCVCILNVRTRDEFRELINSELSVPQALILSRAYAFDINWAEVLLAQYIILQRKDFLHEYLAYLPISDSIIDNVVKSFLLHAQHCAMVPQMEEHLAQLVELIKSVTLKYKLASLLSLKASVMSLINEQTMYYLKDTNYGRSERYNMSEM